jgi:hypothetical protein
MLKAFSCSQVAAARAIEQFKPTNATMRAMVFT